MKTIRLAGVTPNDVINGEGVSVSVWLQGCPHRCKGCHNPEAWDFEGGTLYNQDMLTFEILKLIEANGIQRNLSILGGEPLCPENKDFVKLLTKIVKNVYPHIKIFCWTGYNIEEIDKEYLKNIDILIDGKFEQDKRDITLKLRGSSNQRIIDIKEYLNS